MGFYFNMFLLESGAYFLGGGRESMLFVNKLENDEEISTLRCLINGGERVKVNGGDFC